MTGRDIGLAVLIAAVWGLNFVVAKIGLQGMPPLLLSACRFALVGLLAVAWPRPAVSWSRLAVTALFLFALHLGLMFFALTLGMPAGLASVVVQSQAGFTILLGLVWFGERPTAKALVGLAVAAGGIGLIAAVRGAGAPPPAAVGVTLAGAFCWAIGNLLLKRVPGAGQIGAMAWLSLAALPPLAALSLAIEGPAAIGTALASAGWREIAVIAYIALLSTVFGFGAWGHLLQRYPAGLVAPFSLLVPVFGLMSGWLVLGESLTAAALAGALLVIAGIGLIALPAPLWRRLVPPAPAAIPWRRRG